MDLTIDIRHADDPRARKGQNLAWAWNGKGVDWEPDVVLEMSSAVANRYFQGKENIALALARGIILHRGGLVAKALDLVPIVHPFHKVWVTTLREKGLDHLIV